MAFSNTQIDLVSIKTSIWLRQSTLNSCGLPTKLSTANKSLTNFYNVGTKTLDPANTTDPTEFMLIQGRLCETGHGFERVNGETYNDAIGRQRSKNTVVTFEGIYLNVSSDNAAYLKDNFHNELCDIIEYDCSKGNVEGVPFDIGYGFNIVIEEISKNNDLRKIRILGLPIQESKLYDVYLIDKIAAAV